DDQMVDLLEPCVFDRIQDAARIANRRGARIARVDQQGFTGRRDEQRSVAAFDIDHIHVQRPRRRRLRPKARGGKQHSQRKPSYFQESIAFLGSESGRKSSSSRRTPLGSVALVIVVLVAPVRGSSTLTPCCRSDATV